MPSRPPGGTASAIAAGDVTLAGWAATLERFTAGVR